MQVCNNWQKAKKKKTTNIYLQIIITYFHTQIYTYSQKIVCFLFSPLLGLTKTRTAIA